MNTKPSLIAFAALTLFISATPSPAFTLIGTEFTYQGRLDEGASPANGTYDFLFTVYDSADLPGTVVAGPITNAATVVSNGLFTVTLDFGTNIFNLSERWLEIGARTNGAATFITLAPRHRFDPTPYAITAMNAGNLLGSLSVSQLPPAVLTNDQAGVSLSGTFAGNGGGLTNVSAATLGSLDATGFWQLNGNSASASQFLGTINNQALEIRVNNTRAFRLEPTSVPSVEGGYFQNSTHGFTSAAIVGGGTSGSINEVFGDYGFIGAGHGAKVGSFSAIADGGYNDANSLFSFIGSGLSNTNHGNYSFIGSGYNNMILSSYGVIGGGSNNVNSGYTAIIGGGVQNTNDGEYSFIAGGWLNTIQGGASGSTMGSGYSNLIQFSAYYSTIGGGSYNSIRPTASDATISGGNGNVIGTNAFLSTISGGNSNHIDAQALGAVIGGGDKNAVDTVGSFTTIAGGTLNEIGIAAFFSNIGGGYSNAIAGGANSSAIGGGQNNTIDLNASYTTISGGNSNTNTASSATIGGGEINRVEADRGTIGGGGNNSIQLAASYSTISGGSQNIVQSGSTYGVIAGGIFNTNNALGAVVGGGGDNNAIGQYSIVAGGFQNSATGSFAVLSGGYLNRSSGSRATVPGGYLNIASGDYSFAAGQEAQATNQGSFVWADSQNAVFASSTNDQFLVRANNGFGINTNHPAATLHVNGTARIQGANLWDVNNTEGDFRIGNDSYRFKIGVAIAGSGSGDVWMRAHGGTGRVFLETPGGTTIFSDALQANGVSLAAGSGAWSSVSDRNAKENFSAVDTLEILQRVVSLPLTTWNYKTQQKTIRHIGPMAQDFASAFHVGEDNKHITTIDADGVALAAIQGLNEKLEAGSQQSEARIQKLEAENAELKGRLVKLEQLIASGRDSSE